jgi:host factor-I protein
VNGKRPNDNKKKRPAGGGASKNDRAPEQTYEEVRYLKHLIDNHVPVRVRLRNNEEVTGTIEYYDMSFIRLTREPEPNLFIYKHEIKYLTEI